MVNPYTFTFIDYIYTPAKQTRQNATVQMVRRLRGRREVENRDWG